MLGEDEIKKRFLPQFLTPEGLVQLSYVRERFLDLALSLDSLMPDGREKTLALTELQDASMWAIKSVCCDPKYWRTDESIQQQVTDYDRGFNAGAKAWSKKKPVGFRSEEANDWSLVYMDGTTQPVRAGLLEELVSAFSSLKVISQRSEFAEQYDADNSVGAEDPEVAEFNRGLAEGLKGQS